MAHGYDTRYDPSRQVGDALRGLIRQGSENLALSGLVRSGKKLDKANQKDFKRWNDTGTPRPDGPKVRATGSYYTTEF